MIKIPDSMCLLNCRECGHEGDFNDFTRTPITGDLPPGTYQCPQCKGAWRMEATGPGKRYATGLYIPADRKPVRIPTIL